MATCTVYKHQIDQGSPLFPLLQSVRESGAKDRELDVGYEQVDYTRPGQWGAVQGAGDCVIDRRELLRYAADRWQLFREQLTRWTGYAIPWDMGPEGLEKKTDDAVARRTKSLARVDDAIAAIRLDLEANKISPSSDAGRESMARALFWQMLFPTADEWRFLDEEDRAEMLAAMRGLEALGLDRFKAKLLQAGGEGYYRFGENVERVGGHFQFNVVVRAAPSAQYLYAVFEKAGLSPTFIEITDSHPKGYRCGDNLLVRFGVAIPLSGGLRAFDPGDNAETAPATFVPLSLRQALFANLGVRQTLADMVFGDEMSLADAELFSGDGFAPFYSAFFANPMIVYDRLKKKGVAVDIEDMPTLAIKEIARRPKASHPYFRIMQILQSEEKVKVPGFAQKLFDDIAAHPMFADAPFMACTRLSALSALDMISPEESLTAAHRLLALDPKCIAAHTRLISLGVKGKIAMDEETMMGHLAVAAEPSSSNGHVARVMMIWADLDLKKNRRAEAKDKLMKAIANSEARMDTRAEAAWHYAKLSAEDNDPASAAKALAWCSQLMLNDLHEKWDAKNAAEILDWISKQRQERPLPASVLAVEANARTFALMTREIAMALIAGKDYRRAGEALDLALGVAPAELVDALLLLLHESALQRGDLKEADRIWRDIESRPSSVPEETTEGGTR